jgi:hemerythrin
MHKSFEEETSPSKIRDRIFSQHEMLRGMLAVTVEITSEVPKSAQALETLRLEAKKLYDTLAAHMSFEEAVLPTALRDVIGWGDVLQAQMEEDHKRQRAILAAALSALEPSGLRDADLVRNVREFVDTLVVGMEREERGLAQADFDALASDGEGG